MKKQKKTDSNAAVKLHSSNLNIVVVVKDENQPFPKESEDFTVNTIKGNLENIDSITILLSSSLADSKEPGTIDIAKNLLVLFPSEAGWENDILHWKKFIPSQDVHSNRNNQVLCYFDAKGRTKLSKATILLNKKMLARKFKDKKKLTKSEFFNYASILQTEKLFQHSIVAVETPAPLKSKSTLSEKIDSLSRFVAGSIDVIKNSKIKVLKDIALSKLVFYSLLGVGLIYLLVSAIQVGISSDEFRYMKQAEYVYRFYATLGADKSSTVKIGIDPNYLNGQIVDNLMYGVGKIFGLEENFTFRHLIISSIGWLIVVFTGLIARYIGGFKPAVYTVLFVLLTPILVGNMFNNQRDIPLIAFIHFGIYSTILYWHYYPVINRKYLIYTVIALTLAIASRLAGGILLVTFMGLYGLTQVFKRNLFLKLTSFDKKYWRPILLILGAILLAYALALLTWPYGLLNPIKNSIDVIKNSIAVQVGIYQVFEGKFLLSTAMPKHYVIKYMLITIPFAVLLGLGISLFYFIRRKYFLEKHAYLFLLSSLAISLIFAYFKLGNMYGSWRHFLFTFPFIAILSGMGYHSLFESLPRLKNSFTSMVIVLVLLSHPLWYVLRNHPFEYLYYNELIGGTANAYGNYEWDYSLNSVKQGSEWLKDYIRKNHPKGTKLTIASNSGGEMLSYFKGFDDSISTVYARYYERGSVDWDYAIFPNMYIHPFQLKNNIFPRPDSLYTLKIDGKPLCFIYKRKNRDDLEAVRAIANNNATTAVQKLTSFLKYNPRSEWGWFQLAYIYAQNGNWSQAQVYSTESAKHHPEFMPNLALKGLIYFNTGKAADAKPIFAKLIEDKYDLANAYKWSGMVYENEKNYNVALKQYGFALGAGNKQKELYQKIANCFRQLGDMTQAAKYEAMGQ